MQLAAVKEATPQTNQFSNNGDFRFRKACLLH